MTFYELASRKVKQKDIADRYGCSQAFVSLVVNGKARPTERFKRVASEVTGLPVEILFPERSEPRSQK